MKACFIPLLAALAAGCLGGAPAPAAEGQRMFESGLTDRRIRYHALVGGRGEDSSIRLTIPYGSFQERGRDCSLPHLLEHSLGRFVYRNSSGLSRYGFRLEGYSGPDRVVIGIDVGGGEAGLQAAADLLLRAVSPVADLRPDVLYEVPVVKAEQSAPAKPGPDPASYFDDKVSARVRGECPLSTEHNQQVVAELKRILASRAPSLFVVSSRIPSSWRRDAATGQHPVEKRETENPPLRTAVVSSPTTRGAAGTALAVESLVASSGARGDDGVHELLDAVTRAEGLKSEFAREIPGWTPTRVSFLGYSSRFLIIRIDGPLRGPFSPGNVTGLATAGWRTPSDLGPARAAALQLLCSRRHDLLFGPAARAADGAALDPAALLLATAAADVCKPQDLPPSASLPAQQGSTDGASRRVNIYMIQGGARTGTSNPLFRLCGPTDAHRPQPLLIPATAALLEDVMGYELRFSRAAGMRIAVGRANSTRLDEFCVRAELTEPFVSADRALSAVKAWIGSVRPSETADRELATQACFDLRLRGLLSPDMETSCIAALRQERLSAVLQRMSVQPDQLGPQG